MDIEAYDPERAEVFTLLAERSYNTTFGSPLTDLDNDDEPQDTSFLGHSLDDQALPFLTSSSISNPRPRRHSFSGVPEFRATQ